MRFILSFLFILSSVFRLIANEMGEVSTVQCANCVRFLGRIGMTKQIQSIIVGKYEAFEQIGGNGRNGGDGIRGTGSP
jgi:hypothetical protein